MSVVSFVKSVYQVKESDGLVVIDVERTGDLSRAASVNISNTSSSAMGRATSRTDELFELFIFSRGRASRLAFPGRA